MRSKTARLAAVAGLAVSSLATVIAASTGTAAATGGCVPQIVTSATAQVTTVAGGKAELDPGGLGLIFDTKVDPDSVRWTQMLPAPVPMKDVDKLSYIMRKLDNAAVNAAAAPAYRIFLTDTDGPSDNATLVYEPYWQGSNPTPGTNYTLNVLAGRFWSTKTIGSIFQSPGGPYGTLPGQTEADTLQTWSKIMAANPSAKVTGYSLGQGTFNSGTRGRVNHVIFGAKKICIDTTWTKPVATSSSASASASSSSKPPSSSSSSSKPPSASASSSSGSASASASATTTTAPPAGGGDGQLPKTGDSVPVAAIAVGGAGAVMVGAGLLVPVYRRRRTNMFEA